MCGGGLERGERVGHCAVVWGPPGVPVRGFQLVPVQPNGSFKLCQSLHVKMRFNVDRNCVCNCMFCAKVAAPHFSD